MANATAPTLTQALQPALAEHRRQSRRLRWIGITGAVLAQENDRVTKGQLLARVRRVSELSGGTLPSQQGLKTADAAAKRALANEASALEHEVLLQFLIEAVVLSAFGGLVGIAIVFGACLLLSSLMGMPFLFDPGINLMSFAFSAAIGVVFGFFPARRAAQLDPIEALRHE